MTRVSENSSFHAINYSVGKSKSKLEDLQIKGSNLKRVQKPSDDPIGNIDILTMRSRNIDADQYLRNNSFAKTQLAFTEAALDELTEIMSKAKEIAIGQSSNLYAPEVRQSIAKEVEQLRDQSISIGNRRIGNRYIFGGHKTLTRPFDEKGKYSGDDGKINLEISKDFFIPINMTGEEVFFSATNTKDNANPPLSGTPFEKLDQRQGIDDINDPFPNVKDSDELPVNRTIASTAENGAPTRESMFEDLQTLVNALQTNNFEIVQSLLPKFDKSIDRLVLLRAKIGSVDNSISNAESNLEKAKLQNEEYRTKIEDADVAELFTNLARQKNVLEATYKTSANLMNQSLLDFVR